MFMTKVNKTWNIVIRLIIVAATLYFIYRQVFYGRDIAIVLDFFKGLEQNSSFYLLLGSICFMMLLNLSLEAVKWQLLIGKLESVGFLLAFKAIFTGISVSMFMPNRIGDYLGRVFMLRSTNPVKGILVTIIGSIAQLITTLLAGSLASVFAVLYFFDTTATLNQWLFIGLLLIVVSFHVFLLVLYFNLPLLKPLLTRVFKKWKNRIESYAEVFTYYSFGDLMQILLFSIFRYAVFSLQFYLFLILFNVPISYLYAMMLIALTYFALSIIPTVALSELGIRGSLALYVFGQYFANTGLWTETMALAVLASSTALWIINLAIPALLGIFFVYRLKFFNKVETT